MIKIIVAVSENWVIGNDNKLLWYLPSDLKRFKELTWGSSVVMGRKTFESLGKPLEGRQNIIITRNPEYQIEGCDVVASLSDALSLTNNDCFIIGGGEIYKQTLPIADKIYLTTIHKHFDGDVYFPEIDFTQWQIVESVNVMDVDIDYTFIEYIRK